MSSSAPLNSEREKLLESWQYLASSQFPSYAHWEPINAMSNELTDSDGGPATVVIVGQVVTDKLAVGPLGNFQSQGEKQQRFQDTDPIRSQNRDCVGAKLVVVIRRPTAAIWKSDYDTATTRLNKLQEDVAKGTALRQYLLDKDHNPPFVRVSFPLWEKKKYTKSRVTLMSLGTD